MSINARIKEVRQHLKMNQEEFGKSLGVSRDVIKNYDIEMKVGEDNRVEVKEKLDVHFNKRMHGMYRDLILRDEVDYGGGNKVKRRAGISNIKTSEHYSTETNNGVMRIKGNFDFSFTAFSNYPKNK